MFDPTAVRAVKEYPPRLGKRVPPKNDQNPFESTKEEIKDSMVVNHHPLFGAATFDFLMYRSVQF